MIDKLSKLEKIDQSISDISSLMIVRNGAIYLLALEDIEDMHTRELLVKITDDMNQAVDTFNTCDQSNNHYYACGKSQDHLFPPY